MRKESEREREGFDRGVTGGRKGEKQKEKIHKKKKFQLSLIIVRKGGGKSKGRVDIIRRT